MSRFAKSASRTSATMWEESEPPRPARNAPRVASPLPWPEGRPVAALEREGCGEGGECAEFGMGAANPDLKDTKDNIV